MAHSYSSATNSAAVMSKYNRDVFRVISDSKHITTNIFPLCNDEKMSNYWLTALDSNVVLADTPAVCDFYWPLSSKRYYCSPG